MTGVCPAPPQAPPGGRVLLLVSSAVVCWFVFKTGIKNQISHNREDPVARLAIAAASRAPTLTPPGGTGSGPNGRARAWREQNIEQHMQTRPVEHLLCPRMNWTSSWFGSCWPAVTKASAGPEVRVGDGRVPESATLVTTCASALSLLSLSGVVPLLRVTFLGVTALLRPSFSSPLSLSPSAALSPSLMHHLDSGPCDLARTREVKTLCQGHCSKKARL